MTAVLWVLLFVDKVRKTSVVHNFPETELRDFFSEKKRPPVTILTENSNVDPF